MVFSASRAAPLASLAGPPAGPSDGLAACKKAFPSADQVAAAIVTACRLTGEDPLALARGEFGVRARMVAMDAMIVVFPAARREGLGRCLGFSTPRGAHGNTINARKLKWWRDEHVDEVVGVLVADEYGERAR